MLGSSEDPDRTRSHAVTRVLRLNEGAVGLLRRSEMFCRGKQVGLIELERDQVVGTGLADQFASFFRQCSASAVTPAPASWFPARMASTMCASLSSLFS